MCNDCICNDCAWGTALQRFARNTAQKWAAPRYQDLRASEVALVSSHEGGALVRVIAGEVAGHAGPGSTFTPMTLVHATLSPGARLTLPWRPDYNALAYILAGVGKVGEDERPVQMGQLAVFGQGNLLTISAAKVQESRSPNLDVLILGGPPFTLRSLGTAPS